MIVLATAFVAVTGTLSAAVITQMLAARREKWQWSRRIEQDAERWECEKEERREQWEREDGARWHAERLASYTIFCVSMEQWMTLAKRRSTNETAGLLPASEKELDTAADELLSTLISIELIASPTVTRMARSLHVEAVSFAATFAGRSIGRYAQEQIAHRVGEYLNGMWSGYRDLQSAMRKHIDVSE